MDHILIPPCRQRFLIELSYQTLKISDALSNCNTLCNLSSYTKSEGITLHWHHSRRNKLVNGDQDMRVFCF
ncbi:hypothetical protein DPMN_159401 [Dreissena polymorpha]|uniref:Uncharacterized protein n=1 Tax=Dreissena polymorpha TaxID=45954 RepID=A0A9D4EKP0_DREPO|nr:hypothetical protein DPMN_159401 [Dreissena polymorpha]